MIWKDKWTVFCHLLRLVMIWNGKWTVFYLFSALLIIWTGKWTVFCPLLRLEMIWNGKWTVFYLFSALLIIWTGKSTVFCPLLRLVDDLNREMDCVLSSSPPCWWSEMAKVLCSTILSISHYSYLKRGDVFCHLFLLIALSVLVKELFPFIYFLHTVPNEDFNFKGTVSFFPCPSEWS